MANRQRDRSPAGGRGSAGGRSSACDRGRAGTRTVPVSRVSAEGWSPGRVWQSAAPGVPSYVEPEVRRWPRPVEEGTPVPGSEPALHYIRCALSYQNQLLADIKALLEQIAIDREPPAEEAEKE